MSLKTTLWLLAAVVLLALLLLFLRKDKAPLEEGPPPLVPVWPEEGVHRLDVTLATGEMMALEVRNGVWWVVVEGKEPFVDRAEQGVLNQLHDVLRANARLEVDRAPVLDVLKKLGLEPPRARVAFVGPKGGGCRLRIGERDPGYNYVYVMIEGDKTLYRTGANLSNLLEKGRQEWRDTRFLQGDANLVRRVEVVRPGGERIVCERPSTDWMLAEPRSFAADSAVVRQLVSGLFLLKVDSFDKANPQQEDLDAVGLVPATETRVVLDWGGGRSVTARFGPAPPGGDPAAARRAIDSERGHVFTVSGRGLECLDLDAKQYRDPKLCRVTASAARRISLRRRDAPALELKFKEAARRFEIIEPFAWPADDQRSSFLYGWLLAVSSLQAQDFLDVEELPPAPGGDPWSHVGFDAPRAVLEFELVDNAGIVEHVRLEFADPDGAGTVPVRRPDRAPDTAYLVPEDLVERVISADPRQFMLPEFLPEDILRMKRVTVRAGGKSLTIERDRTQGAEFWRDPADRERNTSDFQAYVAALPAAKALEFHARDPEDADGLSGADAVILEIALLDEEERRGTILVTLGSKDATGTTVIATADCFPPRTVFTLEAWVKDKLLELFDRAGG